MKQIKSGSHNYSRLLLMQKGTILNPSSVSVVTVSKRYLLECLCSVSGRYRRSDLWTLDSTSHQLHPEQTSWSCLGLHRKVALKVEPLWNTTENAFLLNEVWYLHRCVLLSISNTRPGVPTTMWGASAWNFCMSLRRLVPPMQAWQAAPM